jgi:hypothetical protein
MIRHAYALGQRVTQKRHLCRMRRNAAQSITSNTITKINLDTIDFQTVTMGDTTNNRINVRRAGNYLILASWGLVNLLVASSGEYVDAIIRHNGNTVFTNRQMHQATGDTKDQEVNAMTIFPAVAGDYFELYIKFLHPGTFNTETAFTGWFPMITVVEWF